MSIRNPFKSVHAAALVNFGEAVGGLAVIAALDDLPDTRGIVKKLSAEYFKKARGVLTAKCDLTQNGKIDFLKVKEEANLPVVVDILDASKSVVARVTAEWVFSKKPLKKTN